MSEIEMWVAVIGAVGTFGAIIGLTALGFYVAWKYYNKRAHENAVVDGLGTLMKKVEKERDEAREALEQARVHLAGCLTAAEGHIKEPAKEGDYGWSPAYQATLELRRKYEEVVRAIKRR